MRVQHESPDQLDPRAWTAGGVYRVTDGVWRVPLPIPVQGLAFVNATLFVGDDGVIVVDPGWAGPESERIILQALNALEFTAADVRLVIATHNHWDHYSAAVELRSRFGWPLAVGRGEERTLLAFSELLTEVEAGRSGYFPEQERRLAAYGAIDLARRVAALAPLPYEVGVRYGLPDRYMADGEQIPLGGRALTVRATPGHTRGHIVIEDAERGVLVTGDHVLPRITPSIGIEFAPQRFPLRSYLASLGATLHLDDATMIPAHGNVTSSVHSRVRELLDHHEERLATVLRLVQQGSTTVHDTASQLTWTRSKARLEDLGTFHEMAAVLEVLAHLQVLVDRGALTTGAGARGIEFGPVAS